MKGIDVYVEEPRAPISNDAFRRSFARSVITSSST